MYYGSYEVRPSFAGAGPDDPIVTAAGVAQEWLVHQIDNLGGWPLAGALAALGVVAFAVRAAAHRRADRTQV